MNNEEKIYFLPGDVVTLKQDIPSKPIMIVVRKETTTFRTGNEKEDYFKGIRCRWFTSTGELQEEVFNTKDLILIK